MRVVLVTTSYPESQQGSEAAGGFVAEFAQQLARHVDVSVVAATAGSSATRVEGAVEVHRFSVLRWPLSQLNPFRIGDWRAIAWTLRDGRRTLDAVVSANPPQYILALWALPSGHWARAIKRRYGVPYGTWALGSDVWSLGRIPVLRSYLRAVLADADHRFADGMRLADDVRRLTGLSCEFMPSSRRLRKGGQSKASGTAPFRLAYLGRWHHNKGVDLLLDALHALTDNDWQRIAEVRIHGGGPKESEVNDQVRRLQARRRPVSLGGYLNTEQAAELIDWCDYLVLPSRIESIPVVFSDAAQLGCPLIATPVGDLPRLFEKYEFGVLADSVSVDGMVKALQEGLRTPTAGFQQPLQEIAAAFDVSNIVENFAAELQKDVS